MADLKFKINVETNSGRYYSWFTGSFAKTTETGATAVSSSVIVDRINNMPSGAYSDDITINGFHSGGHKFSNAANVFLSASLDGGDVTTGSFFFHHTDGLDSSDRLKRYKFFGTKVCNALGFPENQWIYPSNFQLDDSGNNENFFQGDLNANSLFVRDEISFSNLSKVTSDLTFQTNPYGSSDQFIAFRSGSGGGITNKALIGYDNNADVYKIAGISEISGSATATGPAQPTIKFASSITLGSGKYLVGLVSGTLTGNVNGSLDNSSADDPAPHADPITISGSVSNFNSGGNVEIKAGNNVNGNPFGADVFGGNIILTPGIPAVVTDTSGGASELINGTIQINGDAQLRATDKLYFDGGNNTYITEASADRVEIVVGGTPIISIKENSTSSRTLIYRDLYIDGAANTAGSGDGLDADYLRLHNNGSNSYIDFGSGNLYIRDESTTRITITDSTGMVTIAQDLTVNDDLFVNDFARIDALRVGTTSTDPGDGNLYVEGDITVGSEGITPTSTNVFQCNTTAFNINSVSEGSLGSVTLGTPSVENSTYVAHTNNQSSVDLKLVGEYAISVDLIVDNSATDDRHTFFGYIEHQNSSGTMYYRYPIGGMYIRSDVDGYDAGGIGGQIRLITTAANDRIVVKVLVLDRQNTGTCQLDTSLSRVKIDKIKYG